ncbi:two-component system, NarL family, invasion response regulator UvrY [Mariprofundus micogutta]|uniref:Two-component system, NarL family, invasion response regulator UvrY n=1 Tax=Mariprofundus micogutta TaxID=1921010 RepID=A0A1L8CNQ0_9PROT|nr:response regulator transcription factor [Mariprofundus micogutta]GAV20550.1 two-component system, NarL family, invasion response regulator UvrY [Mariprofundus micogutta]
MISVYLVDDHAVVRAGFSSLLDAECDIQVVGEAASGEEAYSGYFELQPDVVITDISMPGEGGLGFIRRLLTRDIDAKVLVMSMFDDVAFVKRALEYGAMGYISKSDNPDLLAPAVRALAAGETWASPKLAQQLFGSNRSGHENPHEILTSREFEVFVLLALGQDGKEIADALHLSPKTVGTHQTRVFNKLQVKTGAELARLAIRLGIIKA